MAQRLPGKDLIFWSVPAAIACVAGFYAYRAFREPPGSSPASPDPRLVDPCAPGRYRCRAAKVQTTTGEHADGGQACAYREVATCARGCVSDAVTLVVDEGTAKTQLCDLPKRPLSLLSSFESLLEAPLVDAGICEGDGYVPSDEGFIQCISRSGKDPSSAGVVIARARCRFGVVPTLERAPLLIKREEAAAVWCKRDPSADVEPADAAADVEDVGDAR